MKKIKKTTKQDLITYAGVILAFVILTVMGDAGMLSRSLKGQLVPICCYIVMAVSLNLTVGILGELSLGHAGFMSVGAFSGIIAAMSLQTVIPSPVVRLVVALVVGAVFAGVAGALIGIPVLRLRGDYLAIVTLAFGEIIKELINCLIVGVDSKGLHIIFNGRGTKGVNDLGLVEGGKVIIKGAQGATGTDTIASFTAG
ncbi:MAG: branched-chain amino acid ABC transporter permease, partial [Clostridia bacterium]|nr:branched-chain amino acid ABC transporter permease [Clostridia bacterium]